MKASVYDLPEGIVLNDAVLELPEGMDLNGFKDFKEVAA